MTTEAATEATPATPAAPKLLRETATHQIWEYPDGRKVPRKKKGAPKANISEGRKVEAAKDEDPEPFGWGRVVLGVLGGAAVGGLILAAVKIAGDRPTVH